MSIFNRIFGNKQEKTVSSADRISLNTIDQLDAMVLKSKSIPVALFKHSTGCGISRFVLRRFEKDLALLPSESVAFYYLDILKHRDISNAIAKRFGIVHESPQLLIIKDEMVIHSASHHEIDAAALRIFQ